MDPLSQLFESWVVCKRSDSTHIAFVAGYPGVAVLTPACASTVLHDPVGVALCVGTVAHGQDGVCKLFIGAMGILIYTSSERND